MLKTIFTYEILLLVFKFVLNKINVTWHGTKLNMLFFVAFLKKLSGMFVSLYHWHSTLFRNAISLKLVVGTYGWSHSSVQWKIILKFRKIHRKTLVLESHFNKAAGLKACNFIKKTSDTGVFLWILLVVLRAAFFRTPLDDCFWRCHAEFVVVIHIRYPAVIIVKLKEHLEIRGHCSY